VLAVQFSAKARHANENSMRYITAGLKNKFIHLGGAEAIKMQVKEKISGK
jgi:hypothetical protein